MFRFIFCRPSCCYASLCLRWQTTGKIIERTFCSAMPIRPKQPLRPFVRFLEGHRLEYVEKIRREPELRGSGIQYLVGKAWQELPNEEKMAYGEAFIKEYQEYKTLEKHWWNSLSDEQKSAILDAKKSKKKSKARYCNRKKLRELGKPKQPMFSVQEKHFDYYINRREMFQRNSNFWKSISAEERQPYIDKNKKNIKAYHIEKNVWELEMMKKGFGDIIQRTRTLRNRKSNF